jgi:hypothetical protein
MPAGFASSPSAAMHRSLYESSPRRGKTKQRALATAWIRVLMWAHDPEAKSIVEAMSRTRRRVGHGFWCGTRRPELGANSTPPRCSPT